MATKSYAQRITETQVLIDGLKELKSNLPAGIKPNTAESLETLKAKIETLNSEQEKLKAELKTKTEELYKELDALDKIYNDTKKRIKLDVEQSLWRMFGIEDKK